MSKAREWPGDWQMPGPRAVQNLQMPHPGTDKARRQMPHSSRGGGAWCRWNWLMHYDINNSATDNYNHVSNFERKIDSKWLNEKKNDQNVLRSLTSVQALQTFRHPNTEHQKAHYIKITPVNMWNIKIISQKLTCGLSQSYQMSNVSQRYRLECLHLRTR